MPSFDFGLCSIHRVSFLHPFVIQLSGHLSIFLVASLSHSSRNRLLCCYTLFIVFIVFRGSYRSLYCISRPTHVFIVFRGPYMCLYCSSSKHFLFVCLFNVLSFLLSFTLFNLLTRLDFVSRATVVGQAFVIHKPRFHGKQYMDPG